VSAALFRALLLVLLLPVAWLDAAEPARHVVLISLDGLRPEFHLDPEYPAPTRRTLAAAGRARLSVGDLPEPRHDRVFVNPRGDAEATRAAGAALRAAAGGRYTIVSRAELDGLRAMEGAAFAVEAAPGHAIGGACGGALSRPASGGTHGFLPSRESMATGHGLRDPSLSR
jgi:hypothetical protein